MAIEQNNDINLQKFKFKIMNDDYSETILLQDTRYQYNSRQLYRLSNIDETITRQYFDDDNLKQPNTATKTLDNWIALTSSQKNKQTPMDFENVTRNHMHIVLPRYTKIVKKWVQRMRFASKTREFPFRPLLQNYSIYMNGIQVQRVPCKFFTTEHTSKRRLWKHHHCHGRFHEISRRLSSHGRIGHKHSIDYYWYND